MGMYTNLKAGRKLEVWIKKEFILKTLPSMYKNTTCSYINALVPPKLKGYQLSQLFCTIRHIYRVLLVT